MNNQRIVVSLNLKRTIKIMKLTVLMLAVCLSSVVASTYAQTATLNVSAKNETLEKVLTYSKGYRILIQVSRAQRH